MQFRDYYYRYHRYGDHDIVLYVSDEEKIGIYNYVGYLADNGVWMIVREDADSDPKAYRAIMGRDNYAAYWAAKTVQTYVRYDQL